MCPLKAQEWDSGDLFRVANHPAERGLLVTIPRVHSLPMPSGTASSSSAHGELVSSSLVAVGERTSVVPSVVPGGSRIPLTLRADASSTRRSAGLGGGPLVGFHTRNEHRLSISRKPSHGGRDAWSGRIRTRAQLLHSKQQVAGSNPARDASSHTNSIAHREKSAVWYWRET